MPQRFALARHTSRLYLFLVGLLVAPGCRSPVRTIAPAGMSPVDAATVTAWAAPFAPQTRQRYVLVWTYRTASGAAKGRAAVRIAPPDSLRFDFRGPLGKSGAAVVIGDSGIWSRPETDFRDILGAAPLFWAAFGMPRPPAKGSTVTGSEADGRRAWQYVVASDTFTFVVAAGSPKRILAELRREGKTVGLAEATFTVSGDRVASSKLDFPAAESRFSFTVDSVVSAEAFGPDTWRRP